MEPKTGTPDLPDSALRRADGRSRRVRSWHAMTRPSGDAAASPSASQPRPARLEILAGSGRDSH